MTDFLLTGTMLEIVVCLMANINQKLLRHRTITNAWIQAYTQYTTHFLRSFVFVK